MIMCCWIYKMVSLACMFKYENWKLDSNYAKFVFFWFYWPKIIFDQKLFSNCWDKFDYQGSIVYLSCLRLVVPFFIKNCPITQKYSGGTLDFGEFENISSETKILASVWCTYSLRDWYPWYLDSLVQ